MKLQFKAPLKDYPSKLRELALKRIEEYIKVSGEKMRKKNPLEESIGSQLHFAKTPEGDRWWRDVYEGKEISDEWGEENYQIY